MAWNIFFTHQWEMEEIETAALEEFIDPYEVKPAPVFRDHHHLAMS